MYKAPGHALDSAKNQTKASLAAEKDEIAKRFAGALIIRTDGAIRAPVVTLQGEKANLYSVIEKHLRPEVVVGAERFWKLIRAMYNPNLDTWRPRVNGVQLKALQGARLPETDQEWHCVKVVLDTIADWIREDSSPEAFLQELKELVAYCESWWDNRTKREGAFDTSTGCNCCWLDSITAFHRAIGDNFARSDVMLSSHLCPQIGYLRNSTVNCRWYWSNESWRLRRKQESSAQLRSRHIKAAKHEYLPSSWCSLTSHLLC